MALVGSMDSEATEVALKEQKQQVKLIMKRLSENSEPRCSIESGAYSLHYIISNNVVYLTIAEKAYPRKLIFTYLSELSKEFELTYGAQVNQPNLRPYAMTRFESFLTKTASLYADSRNVASAPSSHLDRLNEDLLDVSRVMQKNVEDVLWRGDSLDRMSNLSSSLREESLKYRKAARQVNLDALVRKYAPLGALGLVFIIIIWWKFF